MNKEVRTPEQILKENVPFGVMIPSAVIRAMEIYAEQFKEVKEPVEGYTLEDLQNVWDAAKGGSNKVNPSTGKIEYEEKFPKFNDFFKDYKPQKSEPVEGKEDEPPIVAPSFRRCDECGHYNCICSIKKFGRI